MPINLTISDLLYKDENNIYQSVIAGTPSQQLEDGTVTNTKLASNAVTSNKIADSALTETKYADNSIGAAKLKAESISKVFSGTLTVAGWQGTVAPFSQAITISGVLATDEPIIDLVPSDTYTTAIEEDTDWSNIYRAVTAADTITFYAKEKPTVALNFKARCIRK